MKDANFSEAQRGYIQSLDRGLQLLEILSQAEESMGLPELARLLDVDRSTVHRLLSTLQQRNYVVQEATTKRYHLGLKVIELSRRVVESINLRSISKPYLKRLVQETGESANLCVLASKHAICIDQETTSSPLAVTNDIGTPFLLHATAGGKVLLAYQSEYIQRLLLDEVAFTQFTPRSITDKQSFLAHLQRVREQGYAIDDEEHYLGVRCIAAPVFDFTDKVVAGITVSGPTVRVTLDRTPELAQIVIRAARDLSCDLGWQPKEDNREVEAIHPV